MCIENGKTMDEEEFLKLCEKHLRIVVHEVKCPDDASDMLQICLKFQTEKNGQYTQKTISYAEVDLPYDVRWS